MGLNLFKGVITIATLFLDTNAIMDLCHDEILVDPFVLSQMTLQELEALKDNKNKSESTRRKARNAIKFLKKHATLYYTVPMNTDILRYMDRFKMVDNPDNRICASAAYFNRHMIGDEEVEFLTMDVSCENIARDVFNLKIYDGTDLLELANKEYTGYTTITMDDDKMAEFYQSPGDNTYDLKRNQYIVVKNESDEVVDIQKWDGTAYVPLKDSPIKSKFFGNIKAYNNDIYQRMAIDALNTNKITMLKGRAGTGKSYLAVGWMMHALETHKIDKIICFCNTVATMDSAKLGYYPGSRDEKLLDAQIGNFLKSKFGDKDYVKRMIDEGKLELYPLSDIRGFETGEIPCAVYITEAQNMSVNLMKLALQRISDSAVCIIDGDYNTQVDLASYAGSNNGMRRVSEVYRGKSVYGEVKLINNYRSEIANIAELM